MIFVGRFNTSGLPVPGFGSAGFLHYDPGWQPEVRGLVAQPDGACVVYGTTNYDDAFALGVNGQGDVDPSFGLRELDAPSGGTAIGATTHESDGTTTLGLRTTGSRDVTLWKLLGDGSTDSAFGVGGLSLVPVDPNAIIIHMEPHPSGGFFAVGYVVPGSYYEGCVMRLIANPQ
jgi:hypothetical protein